LPESTQQLADDLKAQAVNLGFGPVGIAALPGSERLPSCSGACQLHSLQAGLGLGAGSGAGGGPGLCVHRCDREHLPVLAFLAVPGTNLCGLAHGHRVDKPWLVCIILPAPSPGIVHRLIDLGRVRYVSALRRLVGSNAHHIYLVV